MEIIKNKDVLLGCIRDDNRSDDFKDMFKKITNKQERKNLVDSPITDNSTLLMGAACRGRTEIVKFLINDCDCNVNLKNIADWTALMFAAFEGHVQIVHELLKKNPEIDAFNSLGSTALHLAAEKGHVDVVKELLNRNAKTDIQDNAGWTCFHVAKFNKFQAIMDLLKKKGELTSFKYELERIISEDDCVEFEEILKQNNKQDNILDIHFDNNITCLMSASYQGREKIVKYLLKKTVQVNSKSSAGWTALMFAVHSRHTKIVRLLLENGADINATNNMGLAAHKLCTSKHHHNILSMLQSFVHRKDKKAKLKDTKLQMDRKHYTILKENQFNLIEQIKTQITKVCNHLFSKSILTVEMKDAILQDNNTDEERAGALLDLLLSRGRNAFEELYNAVLLCELKDAANILKPDKGDHWGNYESTRALSQTENELSKGTIDHDWAEKTIVNVTDAKMLELFEEAQADNAKIYKMQNKCRGLAIIFDNEYFDKFKTRNETTADRQAMKKLMEDLFFNVKVHYNLQKADFVLKLKYYLNEVTDNDECFVVIFLSHGHGGYVFGTDGRMENSVPVNAISVQEIQDMVCKQRKLFNKPKLFFIQACSGDIDDVGVAVAEENRKEAKAVAERLTESETSDGTVPTYADCFIARATKYEYVANRDISGSRFIQTVVYVFRQFAHQYDINTLMAKVNECIAFEVSPRNKMQISEVTHTLRKTFYFFPGLHRQSAEYETDAEVGDLTVRLKGDFKAWEFSSSLTPKMQQLSITDQSSDSANYSGDVYKDNPYNQKHNRVGKPKYSMPISGETLLYKDTPFNRSLSRVGKPWGTCPNKKWPYADLLQKLMRMQEGEDFPEDIAELYENDKAAKYFINRYMDLMMREKTIREWLEQKRKVWKAESHLSLQTIEKYKGNVILFEELKLSAKIGHGEFGDVYMAEWKDGEVVAVKTMKAEPMFQSKRQQFKEKIKLACTLQHSNIVTFLGVCDTEDHIVMEYMDISLLDALHIKQVDFAKQDKLDIMSDIAKGIEYLHESNIAHCDLKISNVLLNNVPGQEMTDSQERVIAKITDFRLSVMKNDMESNASAVDNIKTQTYQAPEVLRDKTLDVDKLMKDDVYSEGLVIWELVQEIPSEMQKLEFPLKKKKVRPSIPSGLKLNRQLKEMLEKCWSSKPEDRPSAHSVCLMVGNIHQLFDDSEGE